MNEDKFRLDSKVAVVTGSGKGIGRAIGLTFARAGANVVFSARSESDIQKNAKEANKFGVKALAIPCDVMDEAQLQELAEKTVAALGGIDIVVNVAGGALPNQIENTTRNQLNEAFDFNVSSAFSFTRICLPHLRKSKGCVVNISSAAGRVIQKNFSVYGTVKAGLSYMTKMMAQDLAPDVRINAIAPGGIMTDALRMFLDEAMLQKMCDLTPMKRLGDAEDIALAALFLASPASSWVTGKVLEIDGGMEATNMPF